MEMKSGTRLSRSIYVKNHHAPTLYHTKAKNMKTDIKIIFAYTISLFLLACNTDSKEERLKRMYNVNYIQHVLDSVFSKDLKIVFDSVYIEVFTDEEGHDNITFLGEGKSSKYFDENVKVLFSPTNGYSEVTHSEVGRISDCLLQTPPYTGFMPPEEFAQKLATKKSSSLKAKEEKKNLSQFAYANKTVVHFGMSADEYQNTDWQLRRNHIEGLIGKGAAEFAQAVFYDNKLVGYKLHNSDVRSINYDHVRQNAQLIDSREEEFSHYRVYTNDYATDLVIVEVRERERANETNMSIDVYWTSYKSSFKH